MRFSISSHAARLLALLAVILIGIALRVYKLDAQSFWYDEGNSARIAERSIQLILEGAAGDIHPPLYYLGLHGWRALFGESMAALRMLSVLCGALLVFFTYQVGRTAFGERVAFLAALLMAFSPFAVYYSQEARMYILLALEAAASTWALLRLAETRQVRGAVGLGALYVLATAAGLYTQYAYPFVMLAQGVSVLLWLVWTRANRARTLVVYAVLNVIALALFVPWLPIAIRQITSWTVTPQDYDLRAAMVDAYRWLVVGRTLPLEQAAAPLLLVGTLALAGVLFGLRRAPQVETGATSPPLPLWLKTVALLLLVLLPFALLFVFKLYREAYLKFLLVCAMPLLVLAAHGAVRLVETVAAALARRVPLRVSNRLGLGALTMVTLLTLQPALNNLYNNPAYARDDYRGIAQQIEALARPGDAVLLNAPNQWEVFTYYHRQGAPAIPLTYRPTSEVAVDQQMTPMLVQYTRLFVLYYGERESDPQGLYEHWLGTHAYKADEQWVGHLRLALYAARATHPVSQALAQPATFGGVSLQSAEVEQGPAAVGDLLTLHLTWRADAKLSQRYKVFVHLGAPDAPPVAQNDAEPQAGYRPTDSWNPGETVDDSRAVWVKPGTPPGVYGLYVGLYDSATGQRLPVSAPDGRARGDRLWLGDVTLGTP